MSTSKPHEGDKVREAAAALRAEIHGRHASSNPLRDSVRAVHEKRDKPSSTSAETLVDPTWPSRGTKKG